MYELSTCKFHYDMLVVEYFQAIPQRQLPILEGLLSSLVQPATVCH